MLLFIRHDWIHGLLTLQAKKLLRHECQARSTIIIDVTKQLCDRTIAK